jgi:hypothetical protein
VKLFKDAAAVAVVVVVAVAVAVAAHKQKFINRRKIS